MSRTNVTKRDRASLRTASPGLRDILNLIGTPQGSAAVERFAGAIMDRRDTGAAPSMAMPCGDLDALLSSLRVPSPPTVDIASVVLDNRGDDLSAYDDAVLLRPLVIPCDFAPQGSIDQWVDHNLPATLARGLRVDTGDLKAGLDTLRRTDAEAWPLVVTGRLKEVLLLKRPFTGFTDEDTWRIVRNAALLLQAAATRMRGALIRRWAARPLGDAVRYGTDWSYVGRILATSLVEPAGQIALILRTLESDPAAALSDTWLARSPIVDLAQKMEGRMPAHSGRLSFKDAHRETLQHLQSRIAPLANVTADQVKSEGLGMRDFVEERLGVSASYACVLLAASLLEASRQIDACIHAVRRSASLPSIELPRFNIEPGDRRHRPLVRATQWLRLTARTDRHAFSGGNGDVNDKAGSQFVKKALASFQKTPPTAAYDALRVDPRVWFA